MLESFLCFQNILYLKVLESKHKYWWLAYDDTLLIKTIKFFSANIDSINRIRVHET
jgi:hypothetical protein